MGLAEGLVDAVGLEEPAVADADFLGHMAVPPVGGQGVGAVLLRGGIDGDVLSVSGPSAGTYADANTGVGKTVTLNPGAVTITGLDGTKPVYGYSVAGGTLTSVMGEITPANLTISTSAVSKPFDGTTSAAGIPVVVSPR